MGLADRISALARRPRSEVRYSADTYLSLLQQAGTFGYGGMTYPYGNPGAQLHTTLSGIRIAEVANSLPGYAAAVNSCPPAFAAELVRTAVLSQLRFTFRNRTSSKTPRRTFGTTALKPLEEPDTNVTTGEMLARMEWHAGLAGNAYVNRQSDRLFVMRPDWVGIVYGSQREPDDPAWALDRKLLGYVYQNGGLFQGANKPVTLLPDAISHWAPEPDPLMPGLGMSWLTPAIRDLKNDVAVNDFKLAYWANGAPQPFDAKILTPTGWTAMGAIRVGDRVIGADGKPHDVVAVYPQGERDIYRVTFSGGASTECTDDHLWTVATDDDRRKGVTRTLTTAELLARGVRYTSGASKWSIPLVQPVEFDDPGPLPIHPYLLGALLGDGSFRSNGKGSGGVSMSTHADDADEQQRRLADLLPGGVTISRRDRGGWSEFYFKGEHNVERGFRGRITSHAGNALTNAVRDLGLFDKLGYEKAIPERYMHGSVTDRLALLQGLMDTDGSVMRRQPNTVRLSCTSRRLVEQVAELVAGLGGIASVRAENRPSRQGRPQWRVCVSRLPDWMTPCRLARKAAMYSNTCRGTDRHVRHLRSIEYVGRKPAQCIGVDSADHLYVTDDFILTHNTPNLVIKGITGADGRPVATKAQFDEIVDMLEGKHAGVANAFRTLYLVGGADATIVGSNLAELDLKAVQGSGETRIAMLSRVPAAILQIAEGLAGSSLNAGNFGQARRIFADTWVYPKSAGLCGALSSIIDVPRDAELWFDTSDVLLLREDAKDAAEITNLQIEGVTKAVREGFTAKSSVSAVLAGDISLLEHTNMVSVQLQPPGTAPANGEPATATPPAGPPTRSDFFDDEDMWALFEDRAGGDEQLHHYWTKGEGLAKWAKSPHPWTALYRHLVKYVGPERAKRMASAWHKEVFGIWVGEKKGSNPVGPG